MEADSFSDLSVPENDYALSALENIFGGIINFIAGLATRPTTRWGRFSPR